MSTGDRGPAHILITDEAQEFTSRRVPDDVTHEQLVADMEAARDMEIARQFNAGVNDLIHHLTPEQRDALARINDHLRALGNAFWDAGQAALDAARSVHGALVKAGLADEQPPTDPMARALWMRQHRNTGPRQAPLNERRRSAAPNQHRRIR